MIEEGMSLDAKYVETITKEEINKLPIKSFEGEIIVIDTPGDEKLVVEELMREKVLGFDTETKPSFKKGVSNQNKVALLQLSTSTKAYLFRLNKIPLSNEIAGILSNKNIKKVGVALNDDVKVLQHLNNFKPSSFVELSEYVNQFNIVNNGLKKLAGIVLEVKISKAQQLSNWEKDILTEGQLRYAATDAWACLEIYNKLNGELEKQS